MNRKEMQRQLKKIQPRLMAALSMLLISAVMLASTSYAWFVLSTAPEAADLTTVAGANGALEIALAGTTIVDEITQPGEPNKMVVGSSSAVSTQTVSIANTYWGNLVDIGRIYGLENMTLYPSRLNLSTGLNNTVLVDSPLAVPQYGTDGRITALRGIQKASYNPQTETYSLDTNYGVHLLGFFNNGESAEEEVATRINRQDIVNTMSTYVDSKRTSITNDTVTLMEDHSRDIYRLLIELMFYLGGDTVYPFNLSGFSPATAQGIAEIVDGLDVITLDALDSLRYAVMARCAADVTNFPNTEEGNRNLGTIFAGFSEMTTDRMAAIASENGYNEITTAVSAINTMRNRLVEAKYYVDGENTNVMNAASLLFDISSISIGGRTGANAFTGLQEMAQSPDHTSEMMIWTNLTPSIFTGMATIIGDYQADLYAYVDYSEIKDESKYADTETIYNTASGNATYAQLYDATIATYVGNYTMPMKVTSGNSASAYDPSNNIGCLATVYDVASVATVDGEIVIVNQVPVEKTAYGYSLDLAFRSNKAGSLQLQQEAVDRVSGLTEQDVQAGQGNGDAMGQGSKMTFTVGEGVSDPAALMEGLYVVFMDTKEGTIYAIATIDSAAMTTDNNTVSAPLRLYTPSITDGMITKGAQTSSILNMEADRTYFITAIVYLNGDVVKGEMLSAAGGVSLTGAVNLQFTTSADLQPMDYGAYADQQ